MTTASVNLLVWSLYSIQMVAAAAAATAIAAAIAAIAAAAVVRDDALAAHSYPTMLCLAY